jgi:serine/threonine-protein kinase
MDLSPGQVVAGRYRADRRVGSGGMGEVWAGEHLAIGVKVAIKALLPAAKVSHEVVARFKREAFLLGRIRSEYVARVLDFVNDEEIGLVLVMELVDGDPLAKLLAAGALSVEECVDLGADVARALCDLHRVHVVHRDLKPGNIILSPTIEGKRRAVLVDFGVSRLLSGRDGSGEGDDDTITGITKANMAVGTVEYMAPEQILSSRDVTGSSDCYALGAILHRAVAGSHVFGEVFDHELAHTKLTKDAPPLRTGRADRVARGLEAVVARALRRRPHERYARAEEMLADLEVLREMAKSAALDVADSTTTDEAASEISSAPASAPLSARLAPPPLPSVRPTPTPEESAFAVPSARTPSAEQRAPGGVPRSRVGLAVTLALAAGAAMGVLVTQRGLVTGLGNAAAPPALAHTALAEAASAATALATAPAASVTPPGPEETAIDLGELDATPRAATRVPGPLGAAPGAPPWTPPGSGAAPWSPGAGGSAARPGPVKVGGTSSGGPVGGAPKAPPSTSPAPVKITPPAVEKIDF